MSSTTRRSSSSRTRQGSERTAASRRGATASRSGGAGSQRRRPATTKQATARKQATTRKQATAGKQATAKASSTRSSSTKTAATRKTTSTRSTGTRAATTRKAPARKTTTRTTSGSRATARKAPAKKTTTRSTARSGTRSTGRSGSRSTARSGTRSTARSGTTARRRRVEAEPAPAPFRARRRNDEPTGRRRSKNTKNAKNTKGRGGGRRSGGARVPATDAGERNAAFLTATVVGLTLFGLVMVLSASSVSSLHEFDGSPYAQFKRQSMWAGIGAVAFLVASRVDYRILRPLAAPLLLASIGMLVALLVPGVGITVQGSTRWLGINGFVVQPSEVAKLTFIVFVADLLTRRERRMDVPELTIRPVMLMLVILSALMLLQPKLGTPIILGAVAILMLFVAGARMRNLVGWLTLAILAASLAAYAAPYRRARLLAFMNPWEDPEGNGFQAIQSQVGIADGGLLGVGLGASKAKWGFLPFAHTDFIFAIVAEEVGLIGASALIGGFLLIAWFGFKAAISAPDRFGSLLAAGITSWLLVQAFLNIGMVLGVLPITGEALPFVSAGGSSLVTMLAAAGLLTNVSRRSS
ncbi:MAG: putative lipid II flippase FtsW [Actinomycetota bacterium]